MPTPQAIIEANAAYWAKTSKITLALGETFSFTDRRYQVEPMIFRPPRICYMKATGGGFSEAEILKTLHGLITNRYPQGALYLFPTNDDVRDFSQSRFNPLISSNYDAIGKYTKTVKGGRKDTDTTVLKRVCGKNLYLRGARLGAPDKDTGTKQATKLSGIQVDRVVFDEVDQMDSDAIAKAIGRMGNAAVDGVKGKREEVYIANPSDEDRGIDLYWQVCDQREWFRTCKCGTEMCAELEFMNDPEKCVGIRNDGTGFIRCINCGKAVSPLIGRWIPQRPGNKDMVGYHWSYLSSIYHDPAEVLKAFRYPPEGNLGDVYRLQLGLPYSAAEDKLQKQVVLANCGNNVMSGSHMGPCAMGVDVMRTLYVVIGIRTGNGRYEVLKAAQVDSFKDVHDLGRRFGVKSAVVDIGPEGEAQRVFQKTERYSVFLCQYVDSPVQDKNFNINTGVVKVFKTGIFDSSHRLLTDGHIRLPRQCVDIDEFARQCCNCVKAKEENKRTGQTVFRYRPTGDKKDHYRSALNYFILAADRIPRANKIDRKHAKVISNYARI